MWRELSEKSRAAASAGWLVSSLKIREQFLTGCDLGWCRAACAGPWLCRVEHTDRERHRAFWGQGVGVTLELRVWMCSRAHGQVLTGPRLPQCSGTFWYILKEGCSARELVQQDENSKHPCLLPACTLEMSSLHPRLCHPSMWEF